MRRLKYLIAAVLLIVTVPAVIAAPATVAMHVPAGAVAPGSPFGAACRPVVTQLYGPTDVAGEPIINGVRFHTGIDLACPAGTPVHTVTDGVAQVIPVSQSGGFGNCVVVRLNAQLPGDTAPQVYFVRYAHLEAATIADGALVHAGDEIGLEGSTGFSTGPHLHFEVDRGALGVANSVNPAPLLGGLQ